jgi:hypothetical protein
MIIFMCLVVVFACDEKKESSQPETTKNTAQNVLKRSQSTRIVGGEPASDNWPWMVALIEKQSSVVTPFCGGSLIAPSWVMTAAHCVENESINSFEIFIGDTDLKGDKGQRVSVKQIARHPDYNNMTLDSDIAMVELSVSLNDYPVIPVLSDTQPITHLNGIVMGWGRTGEFSQKSDTLLQITVPIVSHETCSSSYGSGEITDNMVCAGDIHNSKDACYGDSGGPLIVNLNNQWYIAGIVSWGEGCAREGYYGVYARVSKFNAFIRQCTESNIWSSEMVASGPDQTQKKIIIGVNINSSEQVAPPPPPELLTDIHIANPSIHISPLYKKIYAAQTDSMYTWVVGVSFDMPMISSPVNVSWSPDSFSEEGLYVLLKGKTIDGEILIADMRSVTSIDVFNASQVQYLTICWIVNPNYEISLNSGWNLISYPCMPVITPEPLSEWRAYAYKDGYYQTIQSFIPGEGYWVFSDEPDILSITGIPLQSLSKTLTPGWHLMGSLSEASIPKSNPEQCIERIEQWDGNNYIHTETILPGTAFWVKIITDCRFSLVPVNSANEEKIREL